MNEYARKGIIEATAFAGLLEHNNECLKPVDASYVMPGAAINARDIYNHVRIDNAVFFDIDDIAAKNTALPHMVPTPDDFAKAVSRLGISNDDLVVVYDQSGIAMAAARVWWMFRLFGHDNVCVLNGGLPYWQATGHATETGPPPQPAPGSFETGFRPELICDLTAMKQTLINGNATILDARAADRFAGTTPEPRPGLRAGHIPGSISLPFVSLIDPADGRLKTGDALRSAFGDLAEENNIITSCGSGVTACVLALALFRLGRPDVAVYDGSWSEWGRTEAGTEIATGA